MQSNRPSPWRDVNAGFIWSDFSVFTCRYQLFAPSVKGNAALLMEAMHPFICGKVRAALRYSDSLPVIDKESEHFVFLGKNTTGAGHSVFAVSVTICSSIWPFPLS